MGMDDKIKNAAEDATGRVKEGVGAATDNDDLERQGKIDQADAAMGRAAEHVKDGVDDVRDGLR